MKNLLIILPVLLLFSCAPTKNTVIKYNHLTKEIIKDSILTVDVDVAIDDEIFINIRGKKIKEIKPQQFIYQYDIDERNGQIWFYSRYMSEYMEKNDTLTFEIKYTKR